MLTEFEIERNSFLGIRFFCLISGNPNTKYPQNGKNYLKCLVLGGLVLVGKDDFECVSDISLI